MTLCALGSIALAHILAPSHSPRSSSAASMLWHIVSYSRPGRITSNASAQDSLVKKLAWCAQGSGDLVRLVPLHTLGDSITPDSTPQPPQQSPPGDSLLRCSSNAVWWTLDQLAFVGPDGCLQIVCVPSGESLMCVDTHYFLPGQSFLLNPLSTCVGWSHAPRQIPECMTQAPLLR